MDDLFFNFLLLVQTMKSLCCFLLNMTIVYTRRIQSSFPHCPLFSEDKHFGPDSRQPSSNRKQAAHAHNRPPQNKNGRMCVGLGEKKGSSLQGQWAVHCVSCVCGGSAESGVRDYCETNKETQSDCRHCENETDEHEVERVNLPAGCASPRRSQIAKNSAKHWPWYKRCEYKYVCQHAAHSAGQIHSRWERT